MRLFVGQKDIEDAQKKAKEKIKARNKALSLIDDAKARYIKEKTRARSKKAAMEKDALLNDPKFKALDEYNRREDINEDYGFDAITEAERDRLEDLWDLREKIRAKEVDGYYKDDVTEALHQAYLAIADIYEDAAEYAEKLEKNAYKYIDTETWEEVDLTKERKEDD